MIWFLATAYIAQTLVVAAVIYSEKPYLGRLSSFAVALAGPIIGLAAVIWWALVHVRAG